MAPTRRNLIASVAVAALAPLLAVPLLFLIWPTWMTARYCELTIAEVSVSPDGMLELGYDQELSYGTTVEWVNLPDEDGWTGSSSTGWDNMNPRFLRWPRRRLNTQSWIPILIPREYLGINVDLDTLQQRVLLKAGTYRIRSGESLVYYRGTRSDGRVAEGRIRVKPE
jgi:hypothetical protein